MKKNCILLVFCLLASLIHAQHTFSIVAVDPITKEVGSAGATCLDNITFPGSNGALIISDIFPGRGAIHTQAQWVSANQNKARAKFLEGLSPQEVITFMSSAFNDQAFNPSIRQYGIADLDPATGNPRAAGFTGANCFDYKNHVVGPNYSIQGNILLGQSILDSMEAGFLRTQGSLAEKLMAAMQGANVPGADTRCLPNGTSSLSSFLRVAKPNDSPNNLYINLVVPAVPAGVEPIDTLQRLFDKSVTVSAPDYENLVKTAVFVFPNPVSSDYFFVQTSESGVFTLYNAFGKKVRQVFVQAGQNQIEELNVSGIYFWHFQGKNQGELASGKVILQH